MKILKNLPAGVWGLRLFSGWPVIANITVVLLPLLANCGRADAVVIDRSEMQGLEVDEGSAFKLRQDQKPAAYTGKL